MPDSHRSYPATLGEALDQGYAATAYCRAKVGSDRSSRGCVSRQELCLATLVWTRGRAFPLERLQSGWLKCPRCGSRFVEVALVPPPLRLVKA